MAINWGLGLNYPDAGQAFTQGLRSGATSSALNALLANPNDPNVAQRLAPFNPEGAMQIHGQQQARQAAQAEQDIRIRAAQGDPNARSQLAGIDWGAWSKLDEATRKKAGEAVDFIGQAALQINSLQNENERAAAWSEYVRQAEARGMDIPTEYERYSPGVLQAALAETQLIKEQLAQNEPKYQVVPEGGMLVNTRDRAALAQVGGAAPQAAQGGISEDQAAPILSQAMQTKIISPEDFARIQQSLGPNGQQQAQQWLQSQGIQIGKQVGGKTYVQRGGEWYEVN